MAHTFLLEPGRWHLAGFWLERDQPPLEIKGGALIAWNQEDWFTMVTKFSFPGGGHQDISCQYRGRLNGGESQYTYVLQHSQLGRVEGEGWISNHAIVQRYWVLGDRQRQSGFETFYRFSDHRYYLASGTLTGHYLTSTMEATLERQG
ncbi:hypothetical protein H6G45_06895 [Synechocystis sp. FACHB-383]|uniref:hypothetical protein n=1 Tax=Synechocystis sp. FACHB-383 TaxID=2692864 RepID=UPI001689D5A3|nr:hypothetical protein [Synechocystis sp. FACHB-383]MBD2653217.1 hypothetical protein [Synechocystis sp. FACHB-383]